MTLEEIVNVMEEGEFRRVHCIEKDGDEWYGTIDIFEDESDNSGDEYCTGASICVTRDDGCTMLVYDKDIEHIEIIGH